MRIDKDTQQVNTTHEAAKPATLLELLKVLGSRPLLLTASAVVGGAIGLVAAMQTPASYEAIGLVRMGNVIQGSNVTDIRQPAGVREMLQLRMVEAPAQAGERLKAPGFVAAAKLDGGSPEDLVKAINVRLVKDTDVLEVRYRAGSREAAGDGLRALVDTLRIRHEELAAPARAQLVEQLKVVRQLRSEARDSRRQMAQTLASRPEAAFLPMVFGATDAELARWEVGLQAAMQPPLSTPTALMEEISVTDRQLNPGRVLVVLGGMLAGLLFTAAVILFQYTAGRARRG